MKLRNPMPKICEDCGGEFMAGKDAKFCPRCRPLHRRSKRCKYVLDGQAIALLQERYDFPDPRPEAGPRTLGECLRPGPHMTIADADSFRRLVRGKGASRVGDDAIRVCQPDAPSWTILGALDRGSRQRRAFMLQTADGRLRKMDWQEQAIVQGFPEDFLFVGGLGRTSKMIGQAIPIYVGRGILKGICAASKAGRAAR